MSERYVYKCPKCGKLFTCGLDKAYSCEDCGTKMEIVNSFDYPTLEASKEELTNLEKDIKPFETDFQFNAPISINESKVGKTIISGTLLSEGISKNNNLYSIECMEKLDGLTDIPIYVGTGTNNKHTKESGIIGKILKTTFDRLKRKVLFVAEITNKSIAETVKSGWGISIGGKADGSMVLDKAGRVLTKIKNLILNHIQLLMPSTIRGLDSAQVENVEIQETMSFSNVPKLSKSQILQIVTSLIAHGEIKID
jgi:hypothetical protein